MTGTTTTPSTVLRYRPAKRAMEPSVQVPNGPSATQELSQEDIDQIDPFTYNPPFTACQKLLVFINTLWLAPIRFLFVVVPTFIFGAFMCLLALIGDRYNHDNPQPLGRWGRFIHERVNTITCRWFLFGFGFHWIHVKGTPAPPSEAPILVIAPHTFVLDIFIMAMYGLPTVVAREETRHTPIIGPLITRYVRAIYVSRDDPEARSKSANEIRRRAGTKGAWPHVLIYPEGTTTNKKVLLKYKPGAFAPKLPVQPVLIKYNNKLNTTSWGGDGVGLLGTIFYTLCQFHNSLEVEFLPVYHPSEAEMDDSRLYANNVQQHMARQLGIPAGNQSIEDLLLMKHARSLGLPFSKGQVTYYRATKDTGLKMSEMKTLLTRFAAMDRDKDGFIEVEDLATFLNVPTDACLQAIFDNCKKNSEGKVSFVEYLRGLIKEARPLLESQQFMQEMFNFFDRDNDGLVSLDDITQALPIQALPELPTKSKHQSSMSEPSTLDMNLDNFKALLASHPEYVVLFHECQNAGISSPPENSVTLLTEADFNPAQTDSAENTEIYQNSVHSSTEQLLQPSDIRPLSDSGLPGSINVCIEVEA